MIIEYMNAGSLTDFIYFYFKKIPENVIIYLSREILRSVICFIYFNLYFKEVYLIFIKIRGCTEISNLIIFF